MRYRLLVAVASLLSIVAPGAWAQSSGASAAAGLPPDWEVRQQLADLVSQTDRLAPLIKQIDPSKWEGVSDAYRAQQTRLLNQIQYVSQVVAALARQPDRMTLALDVYFRLQTVESLVLSFTDGIRRYQNPAVADLLASLTNETAASRERLREYVKELVAMREQERDVLEKEAQRCRSMPPRVLPTAKAKTPEKAKN